MMEIMNIFSTDIVSENGIITIVYVYHGYSGTCEYERCVISGNIKKFKKEIYLLVKTDMEDIIECLYQLGHITGAEDLQKINYIIKTHSRKVLDDYLKEL